MSDKTATEIASSLNPTIRDIIRSKNDLIRKLSRDLSELKSEAKDCSERAAESAARVEELEKEVNKHKAEAKIMSTCHRTRDLISKLRTATEALENIATLNPILRHPYLRAEIIARKALREIGGKV